MLWLGKAPAKESVSISGGLSIGAPLGDWSCGYGQKSGGCLFLGMKKIVLSWLCSANIDLFSWEIILTMVNFILESLE